MLNIEFRAKRKHSSLYKAIFIGGGPLFLIPGLLKLLERNTISFDIDFFMAVFNIIVGIIWILHGLNIINSSESCTIKIDENNLFFKLSSAEKSLSFEWDHIERIEIENSSAFIQIKECGTKEVDLDCVPNNDLMLIEKELNNLCNAKNIAFKLD